MSDMHQVADIFFAVANVLSFARIAHLLPANEQVRCLIILHTNGGSLLFLFHFQDHVTNYCICKFNVLRSIQLHWYHLC